MSGGDGFDELAGALLSAAAFRMGKRITLKSVRLASSEDRAHWAARRAAHYGLFRFRNIHYYYYYYYYYVRVYYRSGIVDETRRRGGYGYD